MPNQMGKGKNYTNLNLSGIEDPPPLEPEQSVLTPSAPFENNPDVLDLPPPTVVFGIK
jgi:hypothetical protein